MPQRILLTGASGCIGHYIAERLIQQTDHELFLLVRNPKKLKYNTELRPGIHVIQGDMGNIEQFADLLKTINTAVLTATSWGGEEEAYNINVVKTLKLIELLDPEVCQQVIYFSTASVLGRDGQPLKEAGELGTDYVRTKYLCHEKLGELAIAPKITTVFPTFVFGGDANKPYSHLTGGLPEVARWVGVIRFLKADGGFHFVHAEDIARVVAYLIDHPPQPGEPRELVLGSAPMTVNQAIEEVCAYLNKRIYFRFPLSFHLADIIIALFRIQMADWDRFCMSYRYFTYQSPVSPATFGLPVYCETLADVMKASGV